MPKIHKNESLLFGSNLHICEKIQINRWQNTCGILKLFMIVLQPLGIQYPTRQKSILYLLILIQNMSLLQRQCSNRLCCLTLKLCHSYKVLNNETHRLKHQIHHHMLFMDNATTTSNNLTTTAIVKTTNSSPKVEVFRLLIIIFSIQIM